MKKINLKLFACISALPMVAIPVLAVWGGLNFGSMLVVTVVMAVGTAKVYASFGRHA